jgi:hypothetical protein
MGPRRAAWLDGGLSALADTGLLEQEKAALVLLVNDYVFSHVRLDAQLADADTSAARSAFLPPAVDASRYAALQKAIDAGAFGESARDRNADFAFGLARILDGVDRLVTERRADRSTEHTERA